MALNRAEPPPALSHRGLAVVGIRLLALYLVLRALDGLIPLLAARDAEEPAAGWIVAGWPLVMAVLLWFGVGRLAGWIVPARRSAAPDGPPPRLPPAADAVFAGVGLFLVVDGLADLAALWPSLTVPLWPLHEDAFGPATRIAAGVFVFTGAHGFARLHLWLRFAGRSSR